MAAPTTTNEVTARRLSSVITGLWTKIKDLLAGKQDTLTVMTDTEVSDLLAEMTV